MFTPSRTGDDILDWYSYKPLQSPGNIRLLKLHRRSDVSSSIHCDLIETSLRNSPRYEAISYTWQGQTPTRIINCAGSQLLVTENCFAALHRFRPERTGVERLLWIDSICINQSDGESQEKSDQIALMGDIYASAEQVLVHLEPSGLSDLKHTANLRVCSWLSEVAGTAARSRTDEQTSEYLEHIRSAPVEDLTEFSNEIPWFKRLWTVQEVVLAKSAILVYAQFEISLKGLIKAQEDIDGVRFLQPKADDISIRNMITIHQRATKRMSLMNFMEEARYAKTYKQHDNVYALHGLLIDRGLRLPLPDYSRPVADVYRETAKCLLEAEPQQLGLLLGQVGLPTIIPNLPSWVPDWSHDKHAHRGGAMEDVCRGANRGAHSVFHFASHDLQLVLRGIITDTVSERASLSLIHGHDNLGPETPEWSLNECPPTEFWQVIQQTAPEDRGLALQLWNIRVLRSFLNFAGADADYIESDQRKILDYTLYAPCWNLRFLEDDNGSLQELYGILKDGRPTYAESKLLNDSTSPQKLPVTTTLEYQILQEIKDDERMQKHYELIVRNAFYHTIFRTLSGCLGMALHPARTGDHIAIVAGCRQPLLLRRHGNSFKFIGLAYVYEMMDGSRWPDDENTLEDLVLI